MCTLAGIHTESHFSWPPPDWPGTSGTCVPRKQPRWPRRPRTNKEPSLSGRRCASSKAAMVGQGNKTVESDARPSNVCRSESPGRFSRDRGDVGARYTFLTRWRKARRGERSALCHPKEAFAIIPMILKPPSQGSKKVPRRFRSRGVQYGRRVTRTRGEF